MKSKTYSLTYVSEGSAMRSPKCPLESTYHKFKDSQGNQYLWFTEKTLKLSYHSKYLIQCIISKNNTLQRVKIIRKLS